MRDSEHFDEHAPQAMEQLCELIVPGSTQRRAGRVRRRADRGHAAAGAASGASRRSTRSRPPPPRARSALAAHERTPEFAFVRALAIEAYYSDFVAPGREGPGAWAEIDFNTPLATRLAKDWSYLGIA